MICSLFIGVSREELLLPGEQLHISRKRHIVARHELRAFIGLLCLAGVLKAGHVNVKEFGSTVFMATMSTSKTRFEFLTLCLRFDPDQNEKEMTRALSSRI
jgi:hypothetical protein